MKVSASVELVWQIAAREAKAFHFGAIEPEHFCMAVMKLAELPVPPAQELAAEAEAARDLARDVAAVRRLLQDRNLDGKQTRRAIRARVGKGPAAPEEPMNITTAAYTAMIMPATPSANSAIRRVL